MSQETDFIRAGTHLAPAAFVPELQLHLATELTPLWHATEASLAANGLEPPFWAFAWPGSQALARLILDQPSLVTGRAVLDFAAGCGLAAIAAMRAGAARAVAAEIDPFAAAAITLNAAANGVAVEVELADIVGSARAEPIVLAGDVCYEAAAAQRIVGWLRQLAEAGATVLLADPGRRYAPADGLELVATYEVPTSRELEDGESRVTRVWRVLGLD